MSKGENKTRLKDVGLIHLLVKTWKEAIQITEMLQMCLIYSEGIRKHTSLTHQERIS